MYNSDASVDVAKAIQPRSPAKIATSALILFFGLGLLAFLVFNPRFEWDIVGKYLFSTTVLQGLKTTVVLTALAMVIGVVIGTIMALLLLSDFRPGRWLASVYLWAFRATPPLIQLIFWYNLAYLVPSIPIGIPFMEPIWVLDANTYITPFVAAMLGLGLVEGAYMTEIVRAGLQSVDKSQHDAAKAIGMVPRQSFFRIILPQAMRFILPPAGNQVISMAKSDLTCQRDRDEGSVAFCAADLQPNVRGHSAAVGGCDLVFGAGHYVDVLPETYRASLLTRLQPNPYLS